MAVPRVPGSVPVTSSLIATKYGRWTVREGAERIPVPTMAAALDSRYLSGKSRSCSSYTNLCTIQRVVLCG